MNRCWILSNVFSVLVDMIMIIFMKDFPCGSAGKESTCNAGDLGSVSGFGRSPGEGKGYPLQYSGLENSKDCMVHGVTKSRTRLSDIHFHFHNIGEETETQRNELTCVCYTAGKHQGIDLTQSDSRGWLLLAYHPAFCYD